MAPLAYLRIFGFVLLIAASFTALAEEAEEAPGSDYMPAIRQELARLEVKAVCDDALGTCRFNNTIEPEGPTFEILIRYSQKTDTIYICIENYLHFADGKEPSVELARKLLELNREMVTAKFEWDRASGYIRLSTTVNTDSNFDRRAFRSQIKGIIAAAKRLWPVVSDRKDSSKQN